MGSVESYGRRPPASTCTLTIVIVHCRPDVSKRLMSRAPIRPGEAPSRLRNQSVLGGIAVNDPALQNICEDAG